MTFPGDLQVTDAEGKDKLQLSDFRVNTVIHFVSTDCSVSQVTAIKSVRQANQQKDLSVIIAPMEKLSDQHLAMSRMVRGGQMYFVNDEKWQAENLAENIRLPLAFPVH